MYLRQRDIPYYYLSSMSKYLCQGHGERFDPVLPAVGRSQSCQSIRCASHVRALRRCVSLSLLYLDSRMNPPATRDGSKRLGGPSFERMYVRVCITDGRRKRGKSEREELIARRPTELPALGGSQYGDSRQRYHRSPRSFHLRTFAIRP